MTLEYFKRDPEKWGIIGFLNECREEPFERKIDKYLKQLETIVVTGRKNESKKAKKLLDKYRMEPKSDSKKTRKWNKERLRNIHVNKSTINNKFNYGNISAGPINCSTHVTDVTEQFKETRSKKREYKEIDQLDYTESNVINAAEE
ncbi:21284_t:CDS:2, partial [Cetraspora pellucida]